MTQQPLYGVHIDTNVDGTFEYSYTNDTQAHAKSSRVKNIEIFHPQRHGDTIRPAEATITLSNLDGSISTTFGVNDRVLVEKGTGSTEVFYGEVCGINKKDGNIILNCLDLTNRMARDNLKYNIFDSYVDREAFDIPASPKKFQAYVPNIAKVDTPAFYSLWSFNDAYALLNGYSSGSRMYDGSFHNVGPNNNLGVNHGSCMTNNFIWVLPGSGGVRKFHLYDMSTTISVTSTVTGVYRKNLSNHFVTVNGYGAVLYTESVSTSKIADSWILKINSASSTYLAANFNSDDTKCILVGPNCVSTSNGDLTAFTNYDSSYQSAIDENNEYWLEDVAWAQDSSGNDYAIAVGIDRNEQWTGLYSTRGSCYPKRGVIVKLDGSGTVTKIRDDRADACVPSKVLGWGTTANWGTTNCNVSTSDELPSQYLTSTYSLLFKAVSTSSVYSFYKDSSTAAGGPVDGETYPYLNFFAAYESTDTTYIRNIGVYLEDGDGNTTIPRYYPVGAMNYTGVNVDYWTGHQIPIADLLIETTTAFTTSAIAKIHFYMTDKMNGDPTTDIRIFELHMGKNLGPYYSIDYNSTGDYFLVGGGKLLKMSSTAGSITTLDDRLYNQTGGKTTNQGPITDITFRFDESSALINSIYITKDTYSDATDFGSMLSYYGDVAESGDLYVDLSSSSYNYIVKPVIAVEDPFYYLDNMPPRQYWAYYCISDDEGPVIRQYIGHRDWQIHELYLPLSRVGCDDPTKDYNIIVGIGKGRPDSVESLLTYTQVNALTLPEFNKGPENSPLFKIEFEKMSVDATSLSSTDGLYIYLNMANSNFDSGNHVRLAMSSTFSYFTAENGSVV